MPVMRKEALMPIIKMVMKNRSQTLVSHKRLGIRLPPACFNPVPPAVTVIDEAVSIPEPTVSLHDLLKDCKVGKRLFQDDYVLYKSLSTALASEFSLAEIADELSMTENWTYKQCECVEEIDSTPELQEYIALKGAKLSSIAETRRVLAMQERINLMRKWDLGELNREQLRNAVRESLAA
jgi:MinD superfamily P-loop ATPase